MLKFLISFFSFSVYVNENNSVILSRQQKRKLKREALKEARMYGNMG